MEDTGISRILPSPACAPTCNTEPLGDGIEEDEKDENSGIFFFLMNNERLLSKIQKKILIGLLLSLEKKWWK
jgi:hypothetical protein